MEMNICCAKEMDICWSRPTVASSMSKEELNEYKVRLDNYIQNETFLCRKLLTVTRRLSTTTWNVLPMFNWILRTHVSTN